MCNRGLAGTLAHPSHRVKFLQINIDRKAATHDVVMSRARRDGVDVLIVSEPNKKLCKRLGWFADERMDAAVAIFGTNVAVVGGGGGRGFAWAELSGAFVYACYCSPNVDRRHWEDFLEGLSSDIRARDKPVIVAGDFNSKAAEWGSPTENDRGAMLTEWLSSAGLVVLNQGGGRPTFLRNTQESHIDITMCSEGLVGRMSNWRVLSEETLGWHRQTGGKLDGVTWRGRHSGRAD